MTAGRSVRAGCTGSPPPSGPFPGRHGGNPHPGAPEEFRQKALAPQRHCRKRAPRPLPEVQGARGDALQRGPDDTHPQVRPKAGRSVPFLRGWNTMPAIPLGNTAAANRQTAGCSAYSPQAVVASCGDSQGIDQGGWSWPGGAGADRNQPDRGPGGPRCLADQATAQGLAGLSCGRLTQADAGCPMDHAPRCSPRSSSDVFPDQGHLPGSSLVASRG